MRILDRYVTRQLIPVWVWCILVFVFISILIDLFGHLEDLLQYRIPLQTVLQYYVNFIPLVFVRACPLALLFSSAFVAMRLVRYHELLAMHASGMSTIRSSIPFVFVGWLVSLAVFAINERIVPPTSAVYERLRHEIFRAREEKDVLESVATLDRANRLYHARQFHLDTNELTDLTILEHDAQNHPTRTLYARRGIFTPHGLLLLYGTIYQMGARGVLIGEPAPFVERLLQLPVTPESFRQPETQPETMRFGQLRQLIRQLKANNITNLKRYRVELASKLSLPLMNLLVCLIAFVGSTQRQGRGHLKGLGTSLGWGLLYCVGVAAGAGLGKGGFLPVSLAMTAPHLIALALCRRVLLQRT